MLERAFLKLNLAVVVLHLKEAGSSVCCRVPMSIGNQNNYMYVPKWISCLKTMKDEEDCKQRKKQIIILMPIIIIILIDKNNLYQYI